MDRILRRGRSSDLPALIDVFWRGVHEGAAPRYSLQQRQAWLPARPQVRDFDKRLEGQEIFVTEEGGHVTGFMTLTDGGYLDLAYVLPEVRGTGTADALWAMVLNAALVRRLPRLSTRASDMARPFLARHGWQVAARSIQTRDGIDIPATEMTLSLITGGPCESSCNWAD